MAERNLDLNERVEARDVFLSSESMRKQLNLIGVGYGNVMYEAFQGIA